MTQHLLRKWTSLRGMRVVRDGEAIGRLAGLGFNDKTLRVAEFLVDTKDAECVPVRLPVDRAAVLDEPRRELMVERSGATSGRSEPGRDARAPVDAHALLGKTIQCLDGPVGPVADLLVNIDVWMLRYFLVGVGEHRVMTDIEWCSSFNGGDGPALELPVKALETAPAYPGIDALCSGFEEALYRHYTRRKFSRARNTRSSDAA